MIDKVEFVKLDEPVIVYNFTVADYHTYYVTDLGIWVHNTECSEGTGNVPKYNRAYYGTTPTKSARENTFKRDNYTCQYCGSKNAPLEADHNPSLKSHWYQEGYKMSPEARNAWANNLDNLTTSCRSCNRSKGAKNYPGEWTAADKYKTRSFRLK